MQRLAPRSDSSRPISKHKDGTRKRSAQGVITSLTNGQRHMGHLLPVVCCLQELFWTAVGSQTHGDVSH